MHLHLNDDSSAQRAYYQHNWRCSCIVLRISRRVVSSHGSSWQVDVRQGQLCNLGRFEGVEMVSAHSSLVLHAKQDTMARVADIVGRKLVPNATLVLTNIGSL